MEIPIVVAETQLNVGGFIESIELSVDQGPQGERGSIIFSGAGVPPESPPINDPLFNNVDMFESNDYYIRLSSTGYSWLYKYEDAPGGATWTPLIKLNPPFYVKRHNVVFTSGTGTMFTVPLLDILGETSTSLTEDKFIITATAHYTANDTNVYVISVRSVVVNGSNLEIKLNTRQITTTAESGPTLTLPVNLHIGVGA